MSVKFVFYLLLRALWAIIQPFGAVFVLLPLLCVLYPFVAIYDWYWEVRRDYLRSHPQDGS